MNFEYFKIVCEELAKSIDCTFKFNNCPYCGGELIYDGNEGHELKDGDYFTPNTWIKDFEVYTCRQCGETIKIKA